jgi:hypothetical protein
VIRKVTVRSDQSFPEYLREVIREALDEAEVGSILLICRDAARCQPKALCDMCAEVRVLRGMTVDDVLQAAKAYRA